MAEYLPPDSWESAVANFLEYCQQPMPQNEMITEAVFGHLSKIETTSTAHIRPNVFLTCLASGQPLDTLVNNGTAMEPLSALPAEDPPPGPLKLRSGRVLVQKIKDEETPMVESTDEDNNGDDPNYEDDGINPEDDSGDDDLIVDPPEIRGHEDMAVEDDALTQDCSQSWVKEQPENYINIDGCPRPVPIWDYLGREHTQDIVELLEAEPIQQPQNCYTQLKHWQRSGVGKLLHLFGTRYRGGILGDEQGLGKSLTAIAAMVHEIVANEGKPYSGFNLIVTTKSCAPQWIAEIKRHYGSEMARKAFFLNDSKISANDLLDAEYEFVVCTWQFVMSRFNAYEKNMMFFEVLAAKGRTWVDKHMATPDIAKPNVRHVNALFSPVYAELGLPIKHLVLDEAQFAKNVTTKTHQAVRHLVYDRILLLSGTFLANRWHDLFGLVSLIPGHPFANYQQFMKNFARREANGYYSEPSVSKRNRLVKFLMAFTVSRPIAVLNLPAIHREFFDFELTEDEEAQVACYVQRYLKLMSRVSQQQVFHHSSSSANEQKKAMMQAVLAQQSCSNMSLHIPGNIEVDLRILTQTCKLKEHFAAARAAAGGQIGLKELLAMVTPQDMKVEQATSLDVTEELYNVSLVQQQSEIAEIEGDAPRVIACGSHAYDPTQATEARVEAAQKVDANDTAHELDSPFFCDADLEDNYQFNYKDSKPGEERKAWLARLHAMEDEALFSSKVKAIIRLVAYLRCSYPNQKIVVFSRFLKLLDMLGEAFRRTLQVADMVPLQFNGSLSPEQRSYSQNTFNDPANRQPLFITAGTGGAGLNLTGGSLIIQCEPWWNRNDEEQAQSRCWRLGQQNRVWVYVIRGANSLIDYLIEQCQARKEATNVEIMMLLRRKDDEVAIIPKQYQWGIGEQ